MGKNRRDRETAAGNEDTEDYSAMVEEVTEVPHITKGKPFVDYLLKIFEDDPNKVFKLLVPEGKKYPRGVMTLQKAGIKVRRRGGEFYATKV